MEEIKGWKERLRISKFKLDALLDITLSINANLPTAELLSKYESTLRTNLASGKYSFSSTLIKGGNASSTPVFLNLWKNQWMLKPSFWNSLKLP
jgi:hypothetical protein